MEFSSMRVPHNGIVRDFQSRLSPKKRPPEWKALTACTRLLEEKIPKILVESNNRQLQDADQELLGLRLHFTFKKGGLRPRLDLVWIELESAHSWPSQLGLGSILKIMFTFACEGSFKRLQILVKKNAGLKKLEGCARGREVGGCSKIKILWTFFNN